jgi:hypothetical protein
MIRSGARKTRDLGTLGDITFDGLVAVGGHGREDMAGGAGTGLGASQAPSPGRPRNR